jgi:2'-5' RNA ligase
MAPTSSESKTKLYRYYISYLLDDLPVGAKFKPSALHVTILPWFALETDEKPFLDWFYKHFDQIEAFDATVGEPMMFGPKKDVPVNLIGPKEEFLQLHQLALSWFGELGARWAERDPYVGDDYKPHVAQRRGFVLTEGETMPINSLSLFKASRREDHIREVAAKAKFK